MKTHRIGFGTAMTLMPLALLMATPRVRLTVPPPGRYGIEDLWKATVISDTTCEAWFEGFVFEQTRGQVFRATTKPFRLSLGTRVYQYRDVRVDETQTAPGYEAFVTRQGTLPQGRYSFKLVLQPFPVEGSNDFEVRPTGPPRLVFPRNGAALPAQEKYPMFNWTQPAAALPGARYALRIVEVLPNQTGVEAIDANLPWYEGRELVGQSLHYPTSARPLEAGRTYAWQVRAMTGRTAAESEVWEFGVESKEFIELGLAPRDGDTVSSTTIVTLTAPGLDTVLSRCVFSVMEEHGKWMVIGRDQNGANGWSAAWPTFKIKSRKPAVPCFVKAEAFTRSGGRLEKTNRVTVLRY